MNIHLNQLTFTYELCNAPMVLYNCNGGTINFTYDMMIYDMKVFAVWLDEESCLCYLRCRLQ